MKRIVLWLVHGAVTSHGGDAPSGARDSGGGPGPPLPLASSSSRASFCTAVQAPLCSLGRVVGRPRSRCGGEEAVVPGSEEALCEW